MNEFVLARASAGQHMPLLDLASDGHSVMYPSPSLDWTEIGEAACPFCTRQRRLVSYTLQSHATRACADCMVSHGLAFAVRVSVVRVFDAVQDGWLPSEPRSRASLSTSTPDAALDGVLRAANIRLYETASETRDRESMPRDGAVRKHGYAVDWLLDPSLPSKSRPVSWIIPILIKIRGRD